MGERRSASPRRSTSCPARPARPPRPVVSLARQSTSHSATMFWFKWSSSLRLNEPRAPMPTNARLSFSLGGMAPPRPSTRAGRKVNPATPVLAAINSRRDICFMAVVLITSFPNHLTQDFLASWLPCLFRPEQCKPPRSLEGQAERHLYSPVPESGQCRTDNTESPAGDHGVWQSEVRSICEIIELSPVLQFESLADAEFTKH